MKNPLWMLGVVGSLLWSFPIACMLILGMEIKNITVLIVMFFISTGTIVIYSVYKVFMDLKETESKNFSNLPDKDKLLDLLEDMMYTQTSSKAIYNNTTKNIDKYRLIIKELFPPKKDL